jgi:hypothetical protein
MEVPMTRLFCFPLFVLSAVTLVITATPARAAGRIDPDTVVAAPHGVFNGVPFVRYEAMFEGISSARRPYRVPCQIIAPAAPANGCGLCVFDWLDSASVPLGLGTEVPFARYMMTDDFLFSGGAMYATVRCDAIAIGVPWFDDFDTSSEFIGSPGDEYDIVADYVIALRADPVAEVLVGEIKRMAAFGYSRSGGRLRGLLRIKSGKGLFDFSLVGGTGSGFNFPTGNDIGFTSDEHAPPAEAGLEIDFHTEAEVVYPAFRADRARHDDPNYRAYEFAGCSHLRAVDVAFFGGPAPQTANPADWFGFVRALFVAGYDWCDGVEPPPSVWLGKPKDSTISRDAKGNALVTYVGGTPVNTTRYRLPEVAVGQNCYIAVDFSFDDGSLLGFVRAICGGFVDLTDTFTSHSDYVRRITSHARSLQARGYLLKPDADAIILAAEQSDIGQ